jgi:hypothetical protein
MGTRTGGARRPGNGGMIGCSKKEVKEYEMTYYGALLGEQVTTQCPRTRKCARILAGDNFFR